MVLFAFAGIFLLAAIAFIIKFLVDRNKLEKNKPTEDSEKQAAEKKIKLDIIIAIALMALCEVFILIGNNIS